MAQPQKKPTVDPADLIPVVDRWLQTLTPGESEHFYEFAKNTFSIVEIFLYASFLGYRGPIVEMERWVSRRFKKLNSRKLLLTEIEQMKIDIDSIRRLVDEGEVRFDVGMARMTMLQKEMRSHIESVEKLSKALDKKTLTLTGADRVLREFEEVFGDDPNISPAIASVSQAVWARLTMEA